METPKLSFKLSFRHYARNLSVVILSFDNPVLVRGVSLRTWDQEIDRRRMSGIVASRGRSPGYASCGRSRGADISYFGT